MDYSLIKVGGTIEDIKGMVFWQFQFRVRHYNFCSIQVSLVPQPHATDKMKRE